MSLQRKATMNEITIFFVAFRTEFWVKFSREGNRFLSRRFSKFHWCIFPWFMSSFEHISFIYYPIVIMPSLVGLGGLVLSLDNTFHRKLLWKIRYALKLELPFATIAVQLTCVQSAMRDFRWPKSPHAMSLVFTWGMIIVPYLIVFKGCFKVH